MSDRKTKREGFVSCLSCGETSKTFILERGRMLEPRENCPKCGNVAHTQNLHGLWSFMTAAAKDIAHIKLDMLDLQEAFDDQQMTNKELTGGKDE